MLNKIYNFVKPYFVKLIYRIEYTGELDRFNQGERYIFKSRPLPMTIFFFLIFVPITIIIGLYQILGTLIAGYKTRNKDFNYSSYSKKKEETEIDLYRRF